MEFLPHKFLLLFFIALTWTGGKGSTKKCYSCTSAPGAPEENCKSGELGDEKVTEENTPTPIDGPFEYCVYEAMSKRYKDNGTEREVTYKRYKRSINIDYEVLPTCSVRTKNVYFDPAYMEISQLHECAMEKCNNHRLRDPDPPSPPGEPPPTGPLRPTGPRPTKPPTSDSHHHSQPLQLLQLTVGLLFIKTLAFSCSVHS